jgi:uncharacterized protein YdeI (YjbR/CyaY-like superfamily)
MEELLCRDRIELRAWLEANHAVSEGVWLVLGKTAALPTVSAADALEEALCFGWIDGQLASVGEDKYLKRFTPRRKDSPWSERNRGIAEDLAARGLMAPAGQAAMEAAKADGRWDAVKAPPPGEAEAAALEADLAAAGRELALTNYRAMSPSVRRTFAAHYASAKKPETKAKRLGEIAERLDRNLKPM